MSTMEEILVDIDRVHTHVIKNVALSIQAELVKDSPVDTGWFRANWVPHFGQFSPIPMDWEGRPSRAHILAAAKQQRKGLEALIQMKKPGKVTISNHVPYAVRLAEGSSPQASKGWIRRAIRSGLNNVKVTGAVGRPRVKGEGQITFGELLERERELRQKLSAINRATRAAGDPGLFFDPTEARRELRRER